MSLKITIIELLIPCEYSEQISCSYKFTVARNLHVNYKQFHITYSFHDIFPLRFYFLSSIKTHQVVKYG